MSVASLARLAVARDATPAGERVRATQRDADSGDDAAMAAYRNVVVHMIPTEVLAAYTALVGIVAGAVTTENPHRYLVLRWVMLGAFTAVTPLTLVAAVRSHRADARPLPWTEMAAASIAAVAWFLAMPGSPIAVEMNNTDAAVTSACITVAAGFVLTTFGPVLRRGSAFQLGGSRIDLDRVPPQPTATQAQARAAAGSAAPSPAAADSKHRLARG